MKKGLLSILAAAAVLVSCQNYDDQFDNLNTQISALKTQVDGLAGVQSTITQLQGQLNSLQAAALTSADLDAALSDGLAEISEDVNAIDTSVVQTAEDLDAINDQLVDQQEDLADLLAQGSVFQGDVIVNSVATLETFHALKSSLAIVNGYVDIDAKSDMDTTKLQELVDAIQVTTEQFDYQAETSSVAAVTFNNLSGTQTLTVLQGGDYLFQSLGSATVINLKDDFKSKVTKIDFRELTSVTKFQTSGTDNTISFNKAVELHLTKLAFYAPLNLTIVTDEGAAMPFIMDDVDADGDQSNITLDITGPSSFTATNLEDGSLTFKDVPTVDVDGFEGSFTIDSGVESFSADKVSTLTISDASDLKTLDIIGITDPDSTTDQSGPSITITDANNGDLETVTIAGNTGAIAIDGDKLTTVIISADSAGSINVSDSDDLETLTLTDSKGTGVTVSGNDNLGSLKVDTTITKGRGATAAATAALKVNGSVVVTNNEALETLEITSSNLKTLTVTGNEELASIDGSKIIAVGVTAGASVNIYGNNFIASKSADEENTATTLTGTGKANDLGSFTTTSGMETLKAYLALVAADTKASAGVYFDTVESYVGEDGVEDGTDATYSSETTRDNTTASDEQRILVLVANTADEGFAAVKHKRGFVIGDVSTFSDKQIQLTVDGLDIFANGSGLTYATNDDLELTDNHTVNIDRIKNAAHVTNATAAEVTIDAKRGANSSTTVSLIFHQSGTATSTVIGERYTTGTAMAAAVSSTNHGIGTDEVITFTVGANSVTAALSAVATGSTTTPNTTAVGALADAILAAWATKYGTSGTASATAVVTLTEDSVGILTVTALDPGSRGYGNAVSMSVTASGTTATNGKALDWKIGSTRASSDNSTTSDEIILTVESNNTGTILDTVTGTLVTVTSANGASVFTELAAATYTADSDDDTGLGTQTAQTESRADVRLPDDGEAAATSNAVSFSRVHWL